MDISTVIRETLLSQSQAIENLAYNLDENAFEKAVDLMFFCQGTIVLTGMGKSGNIAAKISSTLNSIGSRSVYLNPGEALHGGLGFLREGDLVIALSKSGETYELIEMIAFIKYCNIPIISITCKSGSTIDRLSNISLIYSAPECCGIGMIPTTSSTVALAIGDSLAISLMKKNKFTLEQFSRFHPRGELGQVARDSIGKVDFHATS